mmetsp:Transcript_551/g.2233  ORF Transcript_551/g.2233 Transcript_551/m.2233 type:complete len:272 (+) Transcript_551:1186-2001(+)
MSALCILLIFISRIASSASACSLCPATSRLADLLVFGRRPCFLVPPLLKNENIGEKIVSNSFRDPERVIFTFGDPRTSTPNDVGPSSPSPPKRVLKFVGATGSAAAPPEPVRLAVDFLIELVMNDASLAGGRNTDPGGVCASPDGLALALASSEDFTRFALSSADSSSRSRFAPRSFLLNDLNNFIALPINPDDCRRSSLVVGDLVSSSSTSSSSSFPFARPRRVRRALIFARMPSHTDVPKSALGTRLTVARRRRATRGRFERVRVLCIH